MEHFKEVLNQPEPTIELDMNNSYASEELEVNMTDVTAEEVTRAINSLTNNKALGIDEISAEMIKHSTDSITGQLVVLFNSIWREQEVPEDWKKGIIVKLPKKGNLSDCNNWRGITLLSTPGKVFTGVQLNRLQNAVDQTLREEQADFRKGRSCTEQIFALQNIIEQSLEHQKDLVINFIDFKKAFDSVHRPSLWKILKHYISIFKALYNNSSCILSPFLFTIVLDYIMRKAMDQPDSASGGRMTSG